MLEWSWSSISKAYWVPPSWGTLIWCDPWYCALSPGTRKHVDASDWGEDGHMWILSLSWKPSAEKALLIITSENRPERVSAEWSIRWRKWHWPVRCPLRDRTNVGHRSKWVRPKGWWLVSFVGKNVGLRSSSEMCVREHGSLEGKEGRQMLFCKFMPLIQRETVDGNRWEDSSGSSWKSRSNQVMESIESLFYSVVPTCFSTVSSCSPMYLCSVTSHPPPPPLFIVFHQPGTIAPNPPSMPVLTIFYGQLKPYFSHKNVPTAS